MRAEPSSNEDLPEAGEDYGQVKQEPVKEGGIMDEANLNVVIGNDKKVSQSGEHAVPAGTQKTDVKDPDFYVNRGEAARFKNEMDEKVIVIIPLDDMDGTVKIFDQQFIHINKNDETKLTVLGDATKGVHRYGVYLTETDEFAVANSTPRIMIEPPEDDGTPPPSDT